MSLLAPSAVTVLVAAVLFYLTLKNQRFLSQPLAPRWRPLAALLLLAALAGAGTVFDGRTAFFAVFGWLMFVLGVVPLLTLLIGGARR